MASPSSHDKTSRTRTSDQGIDSVIQDLGLTAEQESELDQYVLSSRAFTRRKSPASTKSEECEVGTPKHKRHDSVIGASVLASPAKIHERSPGKTKEKKGLESPKKQIGWLGYDARQWTRGSGTPASACRMSFRDKP